MLQLNTYSETIHNQYADLFLPGLKERIKNGRKLKNKECSLTPGEKDILLPKWDTENPDTSILYDLLVSEPKELEKLNKELESQLNYLDSSTTPDRKKLELLFNYDNVISKNKDNSYKLAKIIGRNTCTYCNRQYVFTVEEIDEVSGETAHIVRPSFDHWFSKSRYPLMSLSLYNLIPSCSMCNSSIKGNFDMNIDDFIHPYISEPDEMKFTFIATKAVSDKSEWAVKIGRKKGSKIDNTIKAFKLDEIYAYHAGLEVKDIMDFREAYPEEYLRELFRRLRLENLRGATCADVYRMMFGTEIDSDKFLDRPFSKLKRDLLKQIKVIR